jgi:hypothetical protein
MWLLRRPYEEWARRSTIASDPIAAVPVADVRGARSRALREWLGNPLVVTIVSTVLVTFIVPQLTRQWQDHQKALEIQTALVSSMSESVSDAVISGRMIASGLFPSGGSQRVYNTAIRSWSVDSSVAAAKLEAYFPRSGLGEDWRRYGDVIGDYLLLTGSVDDYRPAVVAQIHDYAALPRTRPPIDWRTLAARNSGAEFQQSFVLLGFALLERRDTLVQRVLAEHPSGF